MTRSLGRGNKGLEWCEEISALLSGQVNTVAKISWKREVGCMGLGAHHKHLLCESPAHSALSNPCARGSLIAAVM
jgi:hypothetical protein